MRGIHGRHAASVGLVLLMLAACSSQKPGPSKTAFLASEPSASVTLRFDAPSLTIRALLQGDGFLPAAAYALKLGRGTCLKPGTSVADSTTLTSSPTGAITGEMTFGGTSRRGLPVGIHIDLVMMDAGGAVDTGCADVPAKTETSPLRLFPPPTMRAGGSFIARFKNDRTLSLRIDLVGLQPNSVHALRIYRGTCSAQGLVDETVGDLGADKAGSASETKVIRIASITGALFVGVTAGSTSDLDAAGARKAGARLILCGELPARSTTK